MPSPAALSYENPLNRLRRVDFFLLSCFGLVLVIGMFFIASACRGESDSTSAGFLVRQIVFVGIGLSVFFALQRVSYLSILRHAPLLYLIGLVLLCGVFATRPINGARSWYNLYFFKLQPSELMKPILILTLAHYLMYRDSYKKLAGLFVPLVLVAVPLLLILKQPDLGTFLAMSPLLFVMLFAAGARLWHLLLMMMCGFGGMVLMWFTVMKDYQKRRVLAWLYPEEYRLGEAWQLLRSETAIGSGGFWGKGWGESSQTGLNLLPEKHTDFIFAVVAEEGGFVLAALLLLLIFFAVLSALGIAERTREPAGRLIVVGCITMLCSQALINAGVALGLLPTTGLTLPFVSYGGSSILSSFICLALIVNVGSTHVPVLSREDFS
ncbi:MAG TPA: FtsW/RodA/SpoVE family cell cycle protein [Planctomycetota bacterium]|nr:FtsW/RodA/SpoVE family cell cycle protein [Planctomycetota bacterium]